MHSEASWTSSNNRFKTSGVVAAACALAIGCARQESPAADEPPSEATTQARSCLRLDLTPLEIARVDEPQRRLFVVAPDAAEDPIAARIHDLESCFGFTDWSGRWSLSVFTDAALARYKDDPQVEAAVKDGRWEKAYLAEYDAASKTLTRNPGGRR
jgi:hypothetical protein